MTSDSCPAVMPGVGYLLDEARAHALARRISAGDEIVPGPSRAVIFLTPRCNMACAYCLSIFHQMPDWRTEDLEALLNQLAAAGTRHVHWTGGEASLDRRLPSLVRRSDALGMTNSISTNASLGPAVPLALAEAGMRRFYISLDTLDEPSFDTLTRSAGRLASVLDTLAALVAARQSGRPVHVTVNTVLRASQVRALLEADGAPLRTFLRWLLQSGVDDFKFLPDSTELFADVFERPVSYARFLSICREEVPARYGMFHLRLGTLASGGHGFHDGRVRHCYHSVDDRVFDASGVYPCVIQLREGGPPVYAHADAPDAKEGKLRDFLESDRTRDPICARCCFDLYRRLNEAVALRLEPATVDPAPAA
jgi:MoaA/NifB/PqqE/SkfB family radical SAM enzyme